MCELFFMFSPSLSLFGLFTVSWCWHFLKFISSPQFMPNMLACFKWAQFIYILHVKHAIILHFKKKKIKFSSYITKFKGIGCKSMCDQRHPHIWGKIWAFPHILGSPSSYTYDFAPDAIWISLYIRKIFGFLFYHCVFLILFLFLIDPRRTWVLNYMNHTVP